MTFYPEVPYNDLPLLPPAQTIESATVLKSAIAAHRMLAELKGKADIIPNQSILINSLILQEARASSEIENIITTNDRLFEAFTASDQDYDPHTKEVLRYREALWMGYRKLKDHRRLSTDLFIDIVQTIKQNQEGIRKDSGTVIANPGTKQIIYTPPEGEPIIKELLTNLETFVNNDNDSLDPLIKMAAIHYQFEAIHPFADGNGRTGRIINILFLVQKELLTLPILYLSDYIINRKSEYYRKIRGVTEKGAWEPWILFMIDAIRITAEESMERIESIKNLLAQAIDDARDKLPSRVYSKELIELLFEQPYCKVKLLVDRGIAKRQTAAEYLKELEHIGLLKSKQVGRENLYLNLPLYSLLSGQK